MDNINHFTDIMNNLVIEGDELQNSLKNLSKNELIALEIFLNMNFPLENKAEKKLKENEIAKLSDSLKNIQNKIDSTYCKFNNELNDKDFPTNLSIVKLREQYKSTREYTNNSLKNKIDPDFEKMTLNTFPNGDGDRRDKLNMKDSFSSKLISLQKKHENNHEKFDDFIDNYILFIETLYENTNKILKEFTKNKIKFGGISPTALLRLYTTHVEVLKKNLKEIKENCSNINQLVKEFTELKKLSQPLTLKNLEILKQEKSIKTLSTFLNFSNKFESVALDLEELQNLMDFKISPLEIGRAKENKTDTQLTMPSALREEIEKTTTTFLHLDNFVKNELQQQIDTKDDKQQIDTKDDKQQIDTKDDEQQIDTKDDELLMNLNVKLFLLTDELNESLNKCGLEPMKKNSDLIVNIVFRKNMAIGEKLSRKEYPISHSYYSVEGNNSKKEIIRKEHKKDKKIFEHTFKNSKTLISNSGGVSQIFLFGESVDEVKENKDQNQIENLSFAPKKLKYVHKISKQEPFIEQACIEKEKLMIANFKGQLKTAKSIQFQTKQKEKKEILLYPLVDGELKIFETKTLNPKDLINLSLEICKDIQIMHDKKCVHFDIKVENFLVEKNDQGLPITARVNDFDTVQFFSEDSVKSFLLQGTKNRMPMKYQPYLNHSVNMNFNQAKFLDIYSLFFGIIKPMLEGNSNIELDIKTKEWLEKNDNEVNELSIKDIILFLENLKNSSEDNN